MMIDVGWRHPKMSEPSLKKKFHQENSIPRIRVILKMDCLDHNPSTNMENIKKVIERMLEESQHFQFVNVTEIMVVKK
jgi:hypothetical protein